MSIDPSDVSQLLKPVRLLFSVAMFYTLVRLLSNSACCSQTCGFLSFSFTGILIDYYFKASQNVTVLIQLDEYSHLRSAILNPSYADLECF